MHSLPVLADAHSRLHADIAVIRLIRAGIPGARISVVFARCRAPNSVCCWLKSYHTIPGTADTPIAAAGLLGRLFSRGFDGMRIEQLENLGFVSDTPKRLQDRLADGKIVLCVHARTELEESAAAHVFRRVGLANVTLPNGETAIIPQDLSAFVPQTAVLAA